MGALERRTRGVWYCQQHFLPFHLPLYCGALVWGPLFGALFWNPLFGALYWEPFIWSPFLGTLHLEPFNWSQGGLVLSKAPFVLTSPSLFGALYLESFIWSSLFGALERGPRGSSFVPIIFLFIWNKLDIFTCTVGQ